MDFSHQMHSFYTTAGLAPLAGMASLFILGMVGSLHCAGMCGPLACAVTGGHAPASVAYQTFRFISYMAVGSLAWGLGLPLRLSLPVWGLGLLVSFPLAAYALWPRFRNGSSRLALWHQKVFKILPTVNSVHRAAITGFLSPLLPCGLLYAAVVACLVAPSIWIAAAWMFSFAAGTLPLLILSQLGFTWMRSFGLRTGRQLAVRVAAFFAAVGIVAFSMMQLH